MSPAKFMNATVSDGFCLKITGLSAFSGNELIRSTAFLTSVISSSKSALYTPVTIMDATFSEETDLISSIPLIPFKDSSIRVVTPSSIS